jgi:hypothetical protein
MISASINRHGKQRRQIGMIDADMRDSAPR